MNTRTPSPNQAKGLSGGSSTYQCFKLTYKSVEGYSILLGRKVEHYASDAEYHLHGCLYNAASRAFIGRVHRGLPCSLVESLQSGAVICPVQQSYFFCSPQEDPSLILVTELTATYSRENELQEVSLGWSMFPVFLSHSKTGARVGRTSAVRLAMYEGSSRALFSMPHPTRDSSSLIPIPGCILTISLDSYPTLARAAHLLPLSTLVSLDDIIPGLIPTKVPEAYPKLAKSMNGIFEKLSLLLLPSVDDFEEQLLCNLAEDLVVEGSGVDENSAIKIEERRLKVMLYNGWRYIGSPAVGYLEKVSHSSKTYNLRSNLLLKGSLELSEVVPHPLLEVVLQLEYVVSWKTHASLTAVPQNPKRSASTTKPPSVHTTPLPLGWAVWQPFNLEQIPVDEDPLLHASGRQVALDLKKGPCFSPAIIPYSAHDVCYKSNLGDTGKVTFRFLPSRGSSRVEGSQLLFGSSVSNVLFEDSFTPSRRLYSRGTPDIGSQTKIVHEDITRKSPLVSSTPVRRIPAEETDAEMSPMRHISHKLQPVEMKQWPQTASPQTLTPQTATPLHLKSPKHCTAISCAIPRSILGYFHHSGLNEFKDIKGNPLPQVTTPSNQSILPVATDALHQGPFRIALQFLGYSFLEIPEQSVKMATRSPSCLQFEVHCHHFPVSILHHLLTPPPSDSPTLPYILKSKPDTTQNQFYQVGVNLQTLPSRAERSRFAAFLRHGHIVIDVYDGDSLLFLGQARVPLTCLVVPTGPKESSNFKQQSITCSVLNQESYGLSVDLASTSVLACKPFCKVVGQIYLRLAKLPPTTEDINRLPKSDITHVKSEKQFSHVARRLYGDHAPWNDGQLGDSYRTEDEATRLRKHARLHRVRETRLKKKGTDIVPYSHMVSTMPNQSSIIDLQREELKRERISNVLQEALTSCYLLRPLMGHTLYLEHTFTNTHNHPLSVSLAWNNPDLKLVVDKRECEYLRMVYPINTVKDSLTITEGRDGGQYGFFIHPGESVALPFKYQSFGSSTPSFAGEDHLITINEASRRFAMQKKSIKVYLQASHRDLVGLIDISVEPRPERVDHVFHFYHPERTYMKKIIEIDTRSPLFLHDCGVIPGGVDVRDKDGPIFVCSSDPEVICEIRSMDDLPTVYIKALVKASPSVQMFHLFFYRQAHLLSPSEVWRIVIHSAQRIGHSLTVGQSSSMKLIVRGDHSHHKVSCYYHSTPLMKIVTPSPFLLNSHSLHELHFSLKMLSPNPSSVLVSAVDVDKWHIVGLWLLDIAIQEPEITRAFQISLPIGDNVNEKTITFTNPYPKIKEYHFFTDSPDVLKFKNKTAKLQSQETTVLYLQFQPSPHPMSTNVLVFINDCADQIQECFLIKIAYLKN